MRRPSHTKSPETDSTITRVAATIENARALFLAAVFVWLYERTGTLAAPIVAHSFFNTVNFFIFIYRTEVEEFLKHLRERI